MQVDLQDELSLFAVFNTHKSQRSTVSIFQGLDNITVSITVNIILTYLVLLLSSGGL